MKSKLISSAMFKASNIWLLIAGLTASFALSNGMFGMEYMNYGQIAYSCSAGLYILSVAATLSNKKFHEEFNSKQKFKLFRKMDRECNRLANEVKKQMFQPYYQKLRRVMEAKREIVDSYFKGEKSYLKEKIAEQTLKLILAYIRLSANYCTRFKELRQTDFREITERINMNTRKMSFAKDVHMAEDLQKVIDMDENLISRMKNEKAELERINAKLEYMEGMVSMFRHQIMSSLETEDMLEKLETAVNEVSALDSVLQERRKNRMRM